MNIEFADLFKLGRAERLQLVEDLWDSIVEEEASLLASDEKRLNFAVAKSVFYSTRHRAGRGSKSRNGHAQHD